MNTKCMICESTPVIARGWCNKHYRRWKKHGDPEATPYFTRSEFSPGTLEHLDENTTAVNGYLDTPCVVWDKAKTEAGYGVVGSRPLEYAHRLSYRLKVGIIPEGMHVLHHCDNPPCTAPDHLFLGTDADNVHDMEAKVRDKKQFKLTDEQLQEAKNRIESGETNQSIATSMGVTAGAINRIRNGTRRIFNVH